MSLSNNFFLETRWFEFGITSFSSIRISQWKCFWHERYLKMKINYYFNFSWVVKLCPLILWSLITGQINNFFHCFHFCRYAGLYFSESHELYKKKIGGQTCKKFIWRCNSDSHGEIFVNAQNLPELTLKIRGISQHYTTTLSGKV